MPPPDAALRETGVPSQNLPPSLAALVATPPPSPNPPTSTPPAGATPAQAQASRSTRDQIDDAVTAMRAQADPAKVAMRRTPRMSIAEINSTDLDTLKERFHATPYDDRGPLTRFIDLIDAPRNVVAGLIAPGLRRKAEERGERAFGQLGRVSFSDMLAEMGVENPVAKGVLGFVGDVLMDPLTYLGGAGVAARVGVKGGASIALRAGGLKALEEGAKEIATHGRSLNPLIQSMARAAGLDALTEARAAGKLTGEDFAKQVRTILKGETVNTGIGEKLSRVGVGHQELSGGALGNLFTYTGNDPLMSEGAKAAREFVSRFGQGTEPGIRIGKNAVQQIAHLPFGMGRLVGLPGDIGISIPAITTQSRLALANLQIARDAKDGLAALGKFKDMETALADIRALHGQVTDSVAGMQGVEKDFQAASERHAKDIADAANPRTPQPPVSGPGLAGVPQTLDGTQSQNLADAADESLSGTQRAQRAAGDPGDARSTAERLSAMLAGHAQELGSLEERKKAVSGTIDGYLEQMKAKSAEIAARLDAQIASAESPLEVLALGRAKDEALTLAREAQAQHELHSVIGPLVAQAKDDPSAALKLAARLDALGTTPEAADKIASAAQALAEAHGTMAKLYAGPLHAVVSHPLHPLIEIANMALGQGDFIVGATPFSSLKNAFRNAGLTHENAAFQTADRLDTWYRRWFGVKNGALQNQLAVAKMLNRGGLPLMEQQAGQDIAELGRLMDTHGIGPEHADTAYTLTHMLTHEAADKAGHAYWWSDVRSGLDPTLDSMAAVYKDPSLAGPLAKDIIAARSAGLLDAKQYPGFADALREFAAGKVATYREMADSEIADRLLLDASEGYVPKVSTAPTQREISRIAANETGAGNQRTRWREPHQMQSTTLQYRYVDPETGQLRRFFEFEKDLAGMSAGEVNAMLADAVGHVEPGTLDAVMEARDSVNRYYQLAAQGVDLPAPRASDFREINELANSGRFDVLRGGYRGDFFESRLPLITARRMAQHERAVAIQNLRTMIHDRVIPIPARQMQMIAARPGEEIGTLPGGVKAFVRPQKSTLGNPVEGIRVGDTLYRQLDARLRGDPMFERFFGLDMSDAVMEAGLASRVEDVAQVAVSDNPDWLKAVDSLTNAFRKVTLFHPSWVVNNTVGHMLNAFAGDTMGGRARVGDIVRHADTLARIFWNRSNPEVLDTITLTLRDGRTIGARDLLRDTEMYRIADPNPSLNGLIERMNQEYTIPSSAGFRDTAQRVTAESARLRGTPTPDIVDRAKGVASAMNDKLDRGLFRPFYHANSYLQNVARAAVYVSYLEQGYSAEQAVSSTIRSVFDYGDLTRVESKLRSLFPFYTWLRNNGAYQIKTAMDRPAIAAAFPKLKEAIEESLAGDATVPDSQRPGWMRDAMAVQYSRDPATRQFLLASTMLPQKDLYEFGQALMGQDGFQEFVKFLVTSTNPALQIPFSIATGKEVFSGRSIGENADMGVGEYLAKQVRPISEFGGFGTGPGPLTRAFEAGPSSLAGRLLLGGKVQDASDERLTRLVARELDEERSALMRRIARAESTGDDQGSLEARAQLMRVFRAYIDKGLGDRVPRWAHEQLAELAPSGA